MQQAQHLSALDPMGWGATALGAGHVARLIWREIAPSGVTLIFAQISG